MAKQIYNLSAEEALGRLGADMNGLSDEEAEKRLKEYGLNKIKRSRNGGGRN